MIFNGTHTLINRETGEHRTFSIKTQPEDSKFAPGERVAALLTGPDNTSDYKGFAFVREDGIVVWSSKKGNGKPSNFEWFADMLSVKLLGRPSRFGKQYEQYECKVEKRCLRCNRKLTHPESLESGFGPECEGRVNGKAKK